MNTKQQATIENIVSGIVARNLGDASPNFTQTEDGGNVYLTAPNWPTIRVGKQGGVYLDEIASYDEGLQAAINGDKMLADKQAREQKKAAAKTAAPAAQTEAAAPVVEEPAFQTGEAVAQ